MKLNISLKYWVILLFTGVMLLSNTSHSQPFNKLSALSCQAYFDSLQELYNKHYDINHIKCLDAAQEQLALAKKCDDDTLFIRASNNLAWVYFLIPDYVNSLSHAQQAYLIADKSELTYYKLRSLNVKGGLFLEMNDLEMALEYYSKGLHIAEEIRDSSELSIFYNNVALVYDEKKDFNNALKNYSKALSIHKAQNLKYEIALSHLNIGDLYTSFKKFNLAEKYQSLALETLRGSEYKYYLFNSYHGISYREFLLGNNKEAIIYADSSLSLDGYELSKNELSDLHKLKSDAYKAMGDTENAYKHLKIMIEYKDSILNSEVMSDLKKIQIDAVKAQVQAQMESLEKDNQIKDLELEKSKVRQSNYFLLLILISLALVFALFMFYTIRKNSRKLKKRSVIIEKQSDEIKVKNQQLEIFNNDMIDSINYAKGLQEAILPNSNTLKDLFDYGYIYLPKDLVSGDFYWLAQPNDTNKNEFLFAVADCTGHGVPGAMVSVVCANALNKSVYDENIVKTGDILDRTSELVEKTFSSRHQLKDGMDVSLISVKKTVNNSFNIMFSGANNPLWILRKIDYGNDINVIDLNDGKEQLITPLLSSKTYHLFEIRPDKQPVGAYTQKKKFHTQSLNIKEDDILYMFSDGIYDQFGNADQKPNGKKLKKSRLKQLLLENSEQPVDIQMNNLNEFLMTWKKGLEQIDDICIFAVKLK
jgi:serine phosphatase RsbU (regulator of sigma subunit)